MWTLEETGAGLDLFADRAVGTRLAHSRAEGSLPGMISGCGVTRREASPRGKEGLSFVGAFPMAPAAQRGSCGILLQVSVCFVSSGSSKYRTCCRDRLDLRRRVHDACPSASVGSSWRPLQDRVADFHEGGAVRPVPPLQLDETEAVRQERDFRRAVLIVLLSCQQQKEEQRPSHRKPGIDAAERVEVSSRCRNVVLFTQEQCRGRAAEVSGGGVRLGLGAARSARAVLQTDVAVGCVGRRHATTVIHCQVARNLARLVIQ